jgi:Transport and Golgi organisation 2
VVVSFAPEDPVTVLLVGVRDEFADRPWRPPAAHWPDLPVIGGLDLQAGGTWLAVNAAARRAACVLNGRGGPPVPAGRRRSRGDLPLRAASGGLDGVQKLLSEHATLERYDGFHLVVAEPRSVTVLSWDGADLTSTGLQPGTHLYTNAGHAYPASGPRASGGAASGGAPSGGAAAGAAAAAAGAARAAYFGPRFAARRPSGDPRRPLADAWGGWLDLAAGDGLAVTDSRALIVSRRLADGRVWGSSSVSLVALAGDGPAGAADGAADGAVNGVRYDFRTVPADTVPVDTVPADTVPADTVPADTVPADTVPADTVVAAGSSAWRTVLP